MARLTVKEPSGYSVCPDDIAVAITRLGEVEDLFEELARQQVDYAQRLEQLRDAGKKNSVQFRELMGKKLSNSIVISALQARGL